MAPVTAPYKFARLVSLFLSFSFGVVGLGLGVDALVKGNDDKAKVRSLVPPATSVDIDTSDAVSAGAVVTAFCAALAVMSLLSLLLLLIPSLSTAKRGPTLATRTLPLQAILLTLLTLGLFGSLVAFTDFVANRQAKVTASIGGIAVPPAIVQGIEKAIGTTPVYHELSYLRLAVILPWIAFLFGAISSVLSLLAASQSRRESAVYRDTASDATGADLANEKKGNVNVRQAPV
ncbi:hypothetical protein L226DRAFT_520196 [Lentinus tigrinus ALCF2SS1-7]|uniref:Transmembrane protein n=1 Tax=Lentinus tigrinus ALCF2SS1-6 TaxID=1328759 RepID=A0A5C2SP48_9APHY|nr:hypothetical protein L227DRAFT_210712 [Lentinus tigrinus ALCF2SS1-6]RPD79181.1 hypothetical protein L226DRAFT_520196 [Lentinus tigrinus ALCF2SS1-7]